VLINSSLLSLRFIGRASAAAEQERDAMRRVYAAHHWLVLVLVLNVALQSEGRIRVRC